MEGLALQGAKLFFALLLIALNGLFVAAEFALVRLRATQVDEMEQKGGFTARLVGEATDRLDTYLAVCQVGITLCSVGLGVIGEPAVSYFLEPVLEAVGLSASAAGYAGPVISFLLVTALVVVLGELAPKTVAIQKAEGTSLVTALPMKFFYYAFLPLVVLFNGAANALTRALGIPPASEGEESPSETEIRALVQQSAKHGMLEQEESEMVGAIFELNDKVAREIMVPRPDVVALPAEMSFRELLSVSARGHYTRYPVYEEEDPDRVIGAVHVKDVLRVVDQTGSADADFTARDLMREVLVVPENRRIDDILEDFQREELQLAVVIDEWGSFEGIVTIEDILEEIVGEIRDEFDQEEPQVLKLPDGSFLIDGSVPLEVANEALDASFESEDFETIGGLVFGELGRAPEVGDEVVSDGYVLRVDETDGPRVSQVLARRKPMEEG
ncbi:MAG: HlyC/CorC family transporter [Rubrobacteraceae bacterium]|nr:HlyC/CorC family transporter [Rubrobacteraceae bacterium]